MLIAFQFPPSFLYSFQLHSTTMDPTSVQPPSPVKSPPSPPPYLPQNPHPPTDAIIEASDSDFFQNGEPSTSRNFKTFMCKLAGRLLPAHQSLIERRFNDILPHELLVPDHPPYTDMILTALWELKAEDGSSEEAISHFIKNEYHDLPWAHATILNHHLRDLCMKNKITMTRDGCYILSSSITKPEPSPSPSSSSSSPLSSAYSSSSTSPSSSSSSSSLSWSGSNRKQKRKRKKIKKRKGKLVKVRGRRRVSGRGRFNVDRRNKLVEPEQGTEEQNEVTVMEVEDCANKDEELPDVIAKISEDENPPCEQNNKIDNNQCRPVKEETEIDVISVRADADDDDVSDAKADEHVEQLEQIEVKGEVVMENNRQEENQQLDIDQSQTVLEERVMNDENLSVEQDSVVMQCVEPNKQLDCLNKEQMETQEQPADLHHDNDDVAVNVDCLNNEQADTTEQSADLHHDNDDAAVNVDCLNDEQADTTEQSADLRHDNDDVAVAVNVDCLNNEQADTTEQSADLHYDNDDVIEETIHPPDQCVEKIEDCEQDQMKNVEPDSAEHEEQQTEVNQEEIVLAEFQQEQSVIIIEQQNQSCIQQTEISEKDSVQQTNNPVKNKQKMTSSSSRGTTEEKRRSTRPGLRSSSKKEKAASNSKKKLELVIPVRRSLRSNTTVSVAAVITEVRDHSKEQVTHLGRTRSSKRKLETAEAEQVSNRRITRSTVL